MRLIAPQNPQFQQNMRLDRVSRKEEVYASVHCSVSVPVFRGGVHGSSDDGTAIGGLCALHLAACDGSRCQSADRLIQGNRGGRGSEHRSAYGSSHGAGRCDHVDGVHKRLDCDERDGHADGNGCGHVDSSYDRNRGRFRRGTRAIGQCNSDSIDRRDVYGSSHSDRGAISHGRNGCAPNGYGHRDANADAVPVANSIADVDSHPNSNAIPIANTDGHPNCDGDFIANADASIIANAITLFVAGPDPFGNRACACISPDRRTFAGGHGDFRTPLASTS